MTTTPVQNSLYLKCRCHVRRKTRRLPCYAFPRPLFVLQTKMAAIFNGMRIKMVWVGATSSSVLLLKVV